MKRFVIPMAAFIAASGCDVKFTMPGPGLSDFNVSLPAGYTLSRSSAHQLEIYPHVPAKVVEIGWNDSFIIAKQQHLEFLDEGTSNETYEVPVLGSHSYWIIETEGSLVHGPLTLDTYDETRQTLGIAKELKLRNVYELRPQANQSGA